MRMQAAAAAHDDCHLMSRLPPALERQLFPFQREGILRGLQHGGRLLIGDEMGLVRY